MWASSPTQGFLFFPVGRGQCAPPLEVRGVSAAAHMGAALQKITGRVRQIGRGRTPPLRIGWRCGAGGCGLPHRCVHRFAMTRILLEVRCMSGGGSAPPVHGHRIFIKLSFRGAQRRGNPFPPCSEGAVRGGCGLPHRCARWFAMTGNFFGGAVHIGGGVRAPRPTENVFNIKCKKTDRIAPVCFFMGLLNFTDCPARRLRLRGGWVRCRWSRW